MVEDEVNPFMTWKEVKQRPAALLGLNVEEIKLFHESTYIKYHEATILETDGLKSGDTLFVS